MTRILVAACVFFVLFIGCSDKTIVHNIPAYQFVYHNIASTSVLPKLEPIVRLDLKSNFPASQPAQFFQTRFHPLIVGRLSSPEIQLFVNDLVNQTLVALPTSTKNGQPAVADSTVYSFSNGSLVNVELLLDVSSITKVQRQEAQQWAEIRAQKHNQNLEKNKWYNRWFLLFNADEPSSTEEQQEQQEQPLPNNQNLIQPETTPNFSAQGSINNQTAVDATNQQTDASGTLFITQIVQWFQQLYQSPAENLSPQAAVNEQWQCSYAWKISGLLHFKHRKTGIQHSFPINFYDLLDYNNLQSPLAEDSINSDKEALTEQEYWEKNCLPNDQYSAQWLNKAAENLAFYYLPFIREYLKINGRVINFMESGKQTLVKIDLGLNWRVQRGDVVRFYRLSYDPHLAKIVYQQVALGVVSELMNNFYSWVAVPNDQANNLLYGDLALPEKGGLFGWISQFQSL